MEIPLSFVKSHLRLDPDYQGDDEYIDALLDAAVEATLARIGGEEQADLYANSFRVAVCSLVGTLYSNRESVAEGIRVKVPEVYDHLVFMMTSGDNLI